MRIEGVSEERATRSIRALYDKFKQMFGHVIAPYSVMAHRPAILRAAAQMGRAMALSRAIDDKLKTLACIRAAQMIGCPF
ncbi:MAG TPA: hypothetical protein VMB26_04445 [Candidatus Binataceae bacterium]|nr:hypothetical protein [Candidatus Binataceae bacterium]